MNGNYAFPFTEIGMKIRNYFENKKWTQIENVQNEIIGIETEIVSERKLFDNNILIEWVALV